MMKRGDGSGIIGLFFHQSAAKIFPIYLRSREPNRGTRDAAIPVEISVNE